VRDGFWNFVFFGLHVSINYTWPGFSFDWEYNSSMEVKIFDKSWFRNCASLKKIGDKYSSGQVTVIGGSELFHGAPLLALKGASRIVSMTYFSSPEEDRDLVNKIKSGLSSFVWVPFDEVGNYVAKSDAVLIGPGMMRSHLREHNFVCDTEGERTKQFSVDLFGKYPARKWVVDGGALQVVAVDSIPKKAVVTPNGKEFLMMFGERMEEDLTKRCQQVLELSRKHDLTILTKDAVSIVSDGQEVVMIEGGNDGLVKGGVGDVIAGVLVGFLAKNDGLFSAAAASYLVKKAAEELAENQGFMFNSDDLVNMVSVVYGKLSVQD
jgi:hydroxyethylthiazole kinase-like uncharacterized protein yjeF